MRRVGSDPIAACALYCHLVHHGLQFPQLPLLPKPLPCEKWRAKDGEVATWFQSLSGSSQAFSLLSSIRDGRCHDRGPIFVANVGRRCAAKVGFSETRPASAPRIL